MVGLRVVLPIRTKSPNRVRGNSRVAAAIFTREKAAHRDVALKAVSGHLRARGLTGADFVPVLVTFVRVSPGLLDDDNVAFALKATRDGVAEALGIDDGDRDRIRFLYDQRKGKRGEHAVEVLVERARGGATWARSRMSAEERRTKFTHFTDTATRSRGARKAAAKLKQTLSQMTPQELMDRVAKAIAVRIANQATRRANAAKRAAEQEPKPATKSDATSPGRPRSKRSGR